MNEWVETYRGMVKSWEIDPVEHFTVAYYFHRLADATFNFLEFCDLGPRHIASARHALATVRVEAQYLSELRAGDILHMHTGVTEVNERGVTVVQRLFNSANDELAAEFEQRLRYMNLENRRGALLSEKQIDGLTSYRVNADRKIREVDPVSHGNEGFRVTSFDTVKPQELDIIGHMSAEHYIHRFSDASTQTLATIGMDPIYMRAHRVGLSTFKFDVAFRRELHVGDRVHVQSRLVRVGNSSIQMLHRMHNVETGDLAAELNQHGVHLNMDTRRPSRVPDAIRGRAESL